MAKSKPLCAKHPKYRAKRKPTADCPECHAAWGSRDPKPVIAGSIRAMETKELPLPPPGEVARYILTCAQNNTHLFEEGWLSLQSLAYWYGARIMVSPFVYQRATHNQHVRDKDKDDGDKEWYDPRIAEFVVAERTRLAPGLVWCGELNILPTAVRPISGLEAYTGRDSSIIPHVKVAMASVASGKNEATKFVYTTGTITQRNYIQRKAGQKAEFHHCYGGLLVEVDSEGSWWCRQLNADSEGVIYDLDNCFDGRSRLEGVRAEAISWGDIHSGQMDAENYEAAWGPRGMMEALRPKHQFLHDVLDFKARNHHDRKNPHILFDLMVKGRDNVANEVRKAAQLVSDIGRSWCQTVLVDSNHDNALERWLREADYREDPTNAIYFLDLQRWKYWALAHNDKKFHVVEHAFKAERSMEGVKFLRQDESYIICKDRNGGIECGMHGHLGPNGSRGSANAFARMGRKAIVGHTHTAGIHDGVYTGGTSSNLDLGYNVGPSSWSHSHVVTYPNGKRAIITVWRGKWRAS